MRTLLHLAFALGLCACERVDIDLNTDGPRRVAFDVRWAEGLAEGPQDGRLVLILSTDDSDEPRFQVSSGPDAQPVFGRNVRDWEAGARRTVDASHPGFPYDDLAAVPPGEYRVQAVLNRYEDFELATGHVVSLPPDRGEGQQWNRKPGNLYSVHAEARDLRTLVEQNRQRGVEIDSGAAAGGWDGRPVDYSQAVASIQSVSHGGGAGMAG